MKFLLFKKHFLILSMLKTLLNMFVKSVILFSGFLDEYKLLNIFFENNIKFYIFAFINIKLNKI